ncbi:MAG: hypothetical protein ACJAT2_001382 [Bacteriovoracaceae bacterium]|jgi:hypothetical protein
MTKLVAFLKSRKFMVIVTLGFLLGGYTHCVNPVGTPKKKELAMTDNSQSNSNTSNNTGSGSNVDSVAIFAATLHPITQMRCIPCHNSFQQPLHAVADPTEAHEAIMTSFKVNFDNVSSSRMAAKLRDESHNCWTGDCNADSMVIENAINDWKNQMEQQGGGGNNNTNSNATAESNYLALELDPNNAMDNGTIGFMTEGATLVAPMVKGDDNGTTYIGVPNGNGGLLQNNNNAAGIGYLQFNLSASDSYKIYGLVNSPTGSDDSFHIRVNQGQYAEWHTGTTQGFEWREVTNTNAMNPMNFFIPAGNGHTLEVRQREDGTNISKIVISNDPNVNLEDVSGALIGTLTYDLSAMLGGVAVQFEIDFQEFDMYSYKFSNPRFVLNGRSVRVKNIQLLVNNSFNPQHSTYTIVDKIVSPADPSASPYSMIVLKDQGLQFDRISFAFETLQLQ